MDLKQRKQEILARLGTDADALRAAGFDIDEKITAILQAQEQEDAFRRLQTAVPTVHNAMTSELAYLSQKPDDFFGKAYAQRLSMIGIPDDCIAQLYRQEHQLAHASDALRAQRQRSWVRRDLIFTDSSPDDLPSPDSLTLSELIMITDDANAIASICGQRRQMTSKALEAVAIAAACRGGEERYLLAFNGRIKTLGWSPAQGHAYTRNECLLTARYKWGYRKEDPWTPETTDLKQYER